MFDTIDLQRFAISSVGAAVLSAACVIGAVGPARAAAPATIEAWQSRVERNIDAAMTTPASLRAGSSAVAKLSLSFDAAGRFNGATLRQTSGVADADREAVQIARRLSYPRLPVSLQGQSRTVAMQLYFGHAGSRDEAVAMIRDAGALAQTAKAEQTAKDRNGALAGL